MSLSLEIETPRLVLRQWLAADRKPFAAMNTDAGVTRYLLPMSAAQSDALADRLAAGIDEYGWGFWAVEAPGVAPFIGFVGIKALAPTLPFAPGVEIGWRLATRYWGNGYVTEAGKRLLQYGHDDLGLRDIYAFAVHDNIRSTAVMRRLGMQYLQGQDFDHPNVPDTHPHLKRHVLFHSTGDIRPTATKQHD